jgi:hypothetical protein
MSQIPQRNLDDRSAGRSQTIHWRLLGLLLTLLLLAAATGDKTSYGYADVAPREVLTAVSSPSDGPCSPDHQSGHHHGNCGLTTSSSACAFVEVDSGLTPERQTTMAVEADLQLRSSESAPPFHPPKTRVTA